MVFEAYMHMHAYPNHYRDPNTVYLATINIPLQIEYRIMGKFWRTLQFGMATRVCLNFGLI